MPVRRGKKAKPTQVHETKKRYRRVDKFNGKVYEDWYEQQLDKIKAGVKGEKN